MCSDITFRPIKLETVVVMRGDKPIGAIRRYRAHKVCQVNVPGVLTASMAIGKGNSIFPNMATAKAAVLRAAGCPNT